VGRTALLAVVVAIALSVGAASAQAGATYYVTTGGNDADPCTQAQPCQTIARGLAAHRAAASPGDVIDVGAGTFVENVKADQTADNGLTIRGTLSGSTRQTTIRGSGAGTPFGGSCRESACAVTLGRSPTTAVKLQDVNVETDAGSNLTALSIVGGSDLSNVDALLGAGSNAFSTVTQSDTGTVIDHSTLDASNGTFTEALSTFAGPTITDSHIIAGPVLGAIQDSATDTLTVTRTWIETSPTGNTAGINGTGSVTLDSSLITGGYVGVTVASNGGNHTVQARNTTVDVAQPGVSDTGANANDFSLNPQSGGNADLIVDSSLLAEGIFMDTNAPPATGTITCTHSDFQTVTATAGFDASNCVSGNDGNTTTDPADQFVGGSPFSWQLKAGAARAPCPRASRPRTLPATRASWRRRPPRAPASATWAPTSSRAWPASRRTRSCR
jgi:hypothetical protein